MARGIRGRRWGQQRLRLSWRQSRQVAGRWRRTWDVTECRPGCRRWWESADVARWGLRHAGRGLCARPGGSAFVWAKNRAAARPTAPHGHHLQTKGQLGHDQHAAQAWSRAQYVVEATSGWQPTVLPTQQVLVASLPLNDVASTPRCRAGKPGGKEVAGSRAAGSRQSRWTVSL